MQTVVVGCSWKAFTKGYEVCFFGAMTWLGEDSSSNTADHHSSLNSKSSIGFDGVFNWPFVTTVSCRLHKEVRTGCSLFVYLQTSPGRDNSSGGCSAGICKERHPRGLGYTAGGGVLSQLSNGLSFLITLFCQDVISLPALSSAWQPADLTVTALHADLAGAPLHPFLAYGYFYLKPLYTR